MDCFVAVHVLNYMRIAHKVKNYLHKFFRFMEINPNADSTTYSAEPKKGMQELNHAQASISTDQILKAMEHLGLPAPTF